MKKLNENEIKELEIITGIIEENGKMSNVGYDINELNYVYGKFAKSELAIEIDVDGDKLEDDLLYVWFDNNEAQNETTLYKVSEEDVEEFDRYFVVDSKFDNKEKTNLRKNKLNSRMDDIM